MAVDWERRIDFDRLRRERLDRIKSMLAKSELGSVLCFDMNNVRYITATHIGTRAGIPLMRGAMSPEMGRSEEVARKIRVELEKRNLHKEPVGVDVVEPPILFALQKEGLTIVDGQQLM